MFHLHIASIFMGLWGLFGSTGLQYSTFEEWVDVSLSVELPAGIEAFCFNLYEDGGGNWSVEIVGAASFDKDDSDWACDEVFTNRKKPLRWSSNQSWERILAQVKSHIKRYLKNGKYASLLLGKQGIGVGFVDGDLILL